MVGGWERERQSMDIKKNETQTELDETIERLKARQECYKRRWSTTLTPCSDCDNCHLLYKQGNVGEIMRDMDNVISLLDLIRKGLFG